MTCATRLPTIFVEMATLSKIFSYSETIMRRFPTSTGTFKRWARMVHGEATQRCMLQPGFMALTSLFMQRSMLPLVETLFSRWMDQMPIAMQIAPCDFYHIMATTIITASGHPKKTPRPTQHIVNVKHYQAYLQSALDNYHTTITHSLCLHPLLIMPPSLLTI